MQLILAVILAAILSIGAGNRYPLEGVRQSDIGVASTWTDCASLADPAFTPVQVTSASDLHTVAMNNCGSGCILELAAGTYTDTNVVFGDTSITTTYGKTASVTPAGEVVIRGADRNNPPLLRAKIGTNAAIIHARNVTARIRVEDVILDGRRSEQTGGAFTPCADTAPANGICDGTSPARNDSNVHGFYTRHQTPGSTTSSCLLRVQVRNTPDTAIEIQDGVLTTVQDSTITGAGCTAALCPAVTLAGESDVNAVTNTGMGIQFLTSGGGYGAVGNTISDVTKIGIECFTAARGCTLIGNTVSGAMNAGIGYTQADGWAIGNTIRNIGFNVSPNAATNNLGWGVYAVLGDAESAGFNVRMIGNSVTNTWGSAYLFALSGPTTSNEATLYAANNIAVGACNGTTRTDAASFEWGDSAQQMARVDSIGNVASASGCARGMYVRKLRSFIQREDTIRVSNGAPAIDYESVLALDARDITVNDDIDIDGVSVGHIKNCTMNGASITGLATNVKRYNCG